MTEKTAFFHVCKEHGFSKKEADLVWSCYTGLRRYVKRNMGYISSITHMDTRQQLKLRQELAEAGMEWTPEELNSSIELLRKILAIIEN